jgi:predicted O-methyltransferase YrrM
MIRQLSYRELVTPELEQGAIYNDQHTGFHEDYLVLHCLLRVYQPFTRFLEIGTNMGSGTYVIKNAIPETAVYSLDLPLEMAGLSKQHPRSEGKGDKVGTWCPLPFMQLLGDSRDFDPVPYKFDGYFIDAEHCYANVLAETTNAQKTNPKLIIWHDTDIEEVMAAVCDALNFSNYHLTRVYDTRISYAVKIQS